MAEIRIHRDHQLGLAKARKIASQWMADVEKEFEMRCSLIKGDYGDTIEFSRSGVNGRLIVAADHFDLNARLGLLLGVFRRTIEAEVEGILDRLLTASATKAPAKKTPAKKAVK